MSIDELVAIQKDVLDIRVDDAILDYVLEISEATRRNEELTIGLSPRGSLALVQACRASAMAESWVIVQKALSLGLSFSIRARITAMISEGLTSLAAIIRLNSNPDNLQSSAKGILLTPSDAQYD
jgi:hypothetical protein